MNAVLLGSVLVVFVTVVNAFGVKLMTRINSAGVAIGRLGALLVASLASGYVM